MIEIRIRVHARQDFAFVADRTLRKERVRHSPKGGGAIIDVCYTVPTASESQIPRHLRAGEGVFG